MARIAHVLVFVVAYVAWAYAAFKSAQSLARFIREGAEDGLWSDEITSNMMASG